MFYYSSKKHIDELLKALEDQDEFNLVAAIRERYEDIMKHMKISEELYSEKKGKQPSLILFEPVTLNLLDHGW